MTSPSPKPRHNRASGRIYLQLVTEGQPGFSRRPDLVVVETKAIDRVDAEIPNYWIVDLTEPVSVEARHLAGEFGYQNAPAVTGVLAADGPFPVRLDLQRLL